MVVFNFQDFLVNFGYLAVFALTLMRSLGNTTFFPIPQVVTITAAVGAGLNPFIIGLVAGLASTSGDVLAYLAGSSSSKFVFKLRKPKIPSKLNKLIKKASFWSVLVVSSTPLPLVFGLLVGSIRYDLRKFILASLIGKTGGSILVAYGGFSLLKILSEIL